MSIKVDVEILDGICGMGKTFHAIQLIEKITGDLQYPRQEDAKVIFATPYRSECFKMADIEYHYSATLKRDVPVRISKTGFSYLPKKKFKFKFYPTMDGIASSTETLKNHIRSNKNIVTTHWTLLNIDQEIIDLLEHHNYHLVIDEAPSLIEIVNIDPSISQEEFDSLISVGAITEHHDSQLEWIGDQKNLKLNRYNDLRQILLRGGCYLASKTYSETHIVWRMNPDLFVKAKSTTILTYLYPGTALNSYFTWMDLDVKVSDLTTEGYLFNDRIQPYDELINLYEPKGLHDKEFNNEHALSANWYNTTAANNNLKANATGTFEKTNKQTGFETLTIKTKSFFSTKVIHKDFLKLETWLQTKVKDGQISAQEKAQLLFDIQNTLIESTAANERLWTTYKAYKELLIPKTGANFSDSNFLVFSQKATNDFNHVKQMAYLVNVYPNVVLSSFLNRVEAPLDSDKHAVSELVQWIFRSRVRNGGYISLFIASARMRRLYKEWIGQFEKMREEKHEAYFSDELLQKLENIRDVIPK